MLGRRLAFAVALLACVVAVGGSPGLCAFVTVVLTEDFVDCSLALVQSIRGTDTEHEVVVLVLPEVSEAARSKLRESGAHHVVQMEEVNNPNKVVQYKIFAKNYGILRAWQLSELVGKSYRRAVYMDSDMVMTQNSDDLCQMPELSAARDLGGKPGEHAAGHIAEFNAGLMVLEPSEATFQRLMTLALEVSSPSGGVQPLLRAAFPDYSSLDHLRDNVNARVYELSPSLWKLGRIRSIHFTGPVKPCFTSAGDWDSEAKDHPIRVWHRLQGRIEEKPVGKQLPHVAVASDREAWQNWFRANGGAILRAGFGWGEDELKVVPAFHVCKHASAAMGLLAEQAFRAAYRQLQGCQDLTAGGCDEIAEVTKEIARAAQQMQSTVQLFLQRSSNDALVDIAGLGSVESILARHVAAVSDEVQRHLKRLSAVQITCGPKCFTFDVAVNLVRKLGRQEELMRWHLSHALLALLWWQIDQLRQSGSSPAMVPDDFKMQLPRVEFQWQCCRSWDVIAGLLGSSQSTQVIFVGGPSASGELEEILPALVPDLRVLEVPFDSDFAEEAAGSLILLGCSAAEHDAAPEHEFAYIRAELANWWKRGAVVAGCGFVVSQLGLVEAVSQHAAQVDALIAVSADAVWWLAASEQ